MVTRLPCTRCGDSIHPDTVRDNAGLCMPCVNGNTQTIEERLEKRRLEKEEQEDWDDDPESIYWDDLLERLDQADENLSALSHGDQLYYLISRFGGEVHNGGFEQFFSNSSGDYFEETAAALRELRATVPLGFLEAAKRAVFGETPVPAERDKRWTFLPTVDEDGDVAPQCEALHKELDALDRTFYAADSEKEIRDILDRVVAEYKLY